MWNARERPYCEPSFWETRLREAIEKGSVNDAVYSTNGEVWAAVEERHRGIIASCVEPDDSVLDVGCAWGRMLGLMPATWRGAYLGFDITPAFIAKARAEHPPRPNLRFMVGDMRDPAFLDRAVADMALPGGTFAWGIGLSVERGIVGHLGAAAWAGIEATLLKRCRKLLLMDINVDGDWRIEEGTR